MKDVLTILLAGGAGERLLPLTSAIAKPAVPFGGHYRIVDFTLSNIVNSGLRRILVMTQYKSLVLHRHLREGWNIFGRELGEYLEVLPPMKRVHSDWYLGTADAVYQNIESIEQELPEAVLILSGDHIYKMDYREMTDWHRPRPTASAFSTSTPQPCFARASRKSPRMAIPVHRLSTRIWSAPRWGSTFFRPASCSTRCAPMPPTPIPVTTLATTSCPG
jgi:NDP-sugar pyrophosphorylase family protein